MADTLPQKGMKVWKRMRAFYRLLNADSKDMKNDPWVLYFLNLDMASIAYSCTQLACSDYKTLCWTHNLLRDEWHMQNTPSELACRKTCVDLSERHEVLTII